MKAADLVGVLIAETEDGEKVAEIVVAAEMTIDGGKIRGRILDHSYWEVGPVDREVRRVVLYCDGLPLAIVWEGRAPEGTVLKVEFDSPKRCPHCGEALE